MEFHSDFPKLVTGPICNQVSVKHLPEPLSEINAKYCLTLLQVHHWLFGLSLDAVSAKNKMNTKYPKCIHNKIKIILWLPSFGYRIKAKIILDAKKSSSFVVAEP